MTKYPPTSSLTPVAVFICSQLCGSCRAQLGGSAAGLVWGLMLLQSDGNQDWEIQDRSPHLSRVSAGITSCDLLMASTGLCTGRWSPEVAFQEHVHHICWCLSVGGAYAGLSAR